MWQKKTYPTYHNTFDRFTQIKCMFCKVFTSLRNAFIVGFDVNAVRGSWARALILADIPRCKKRQSIGHLIVIKVSFQNIPTCHNVSETRVSETTFGAKKRRSRLADPPTSCQSLRHTRGSHVKPPNSHWRERQTSNYISQQSRVEQWWFRQSHQAYNARRSGLTRLPLSRYWQVDKLHNSTWHFCFDRFGDLHLRVVVLGRPMEHVKSCVDMSSLRYAIASTNGFVSIVFHLVP